MSTRLLLATLLAAASAVSVELLLPDARLPGDAEAALDLPDIVRRHGYRADVHRVVTEDGYVLALFRMRNATAARVGAPVLLVPGLLLTAECWVDAGPGVGLAYLLADAGRDVWLANQRGTAHGRDHVTLRPDRDADFWKFSYHHMGVYDQPAIVDTVLAQTGAADLLYVGYSQGAGALVIMCSERPEYCSRVRGAVLLAPASRMIGSRSPALRALAAASAAAVSLGVAGEALGRGAGLRGALRAACGAELCPALLWLADASRARSVSARTWRAASGHFPSGTSLHNLAHFAQALSEEEFRAPELGRAGNLAAYGSAQAPRYRPERMRARAAVVAGRADRVVAASDARWLSRGLPRLRRFSLVADPRWNHFDVPYSRHVPLALYPLVARYLRSFDQPDNQTDFTNYV